MDPTAVDQLQRAGIPTDLRVLPIVDVHPGPPGERIGVRAGEARAELALMPLSALFAGDRQPGEVSHETGSPYLLFFAVVERAAYDFCRLTGRSVTDRDFERVYRQLRRRPDGADPDPLVAWLQAACRLYLSLTDVSQAEYEAVLQRLSMTARKYANHHGSHNYLGILDGQFGRFVGGPPAP